MPEPQKPRGEVSDTDVREPGPGSEREAVTAAADPEWPTEDQGAAASQAHASKEADLRVMKAEQAKVFINLDSDDD